MVETQALPFSVESLLPLSLRGETLSSLTHCRRFWLLLAVSCLGCIWQFFCLTLGLRSSRNSLQEARASVAGTDDVPESEWRRDSTPEALELLWREGDEETVPVPDAAQLDTRATQSFETPKLCKKPVFGNFKTLVTPTGKVRKVIHPHPDLGIPPQGLDEDVAIKKMLIHGIPLSEAIPNGTAGACALVSTAGAFIGSSAGQQIDDYELVFRMNWGGAVLPVLRPNDFGERTNVLFMGHRDFTFCSNGESCRLCIPHVLDEHGRRPSEIMQITVVYIYTPEQLHKFMACREELGADSWRLQMLHPDMAEKKSFSFMKKWKWDVSSKLSAGFITFLLAKSMCHHIELFGFLGIDNTAPYHAYKWCDVDRVFHMTTRDCVGARSNDGTKTEDGFVRPISEIGHDFATERKVMYSRTIRNKECRVKCVCSSKLLTKKPAEEANETVYEASTSEDAPA